MKVCFLSIDNQTLFEVPPYLFKISKIFLTNTLTRLEFIFPNQADLTKILSTQASILQVENIVNRFHTQDGLVHAVNGVSFDLKKGELFGIVGESGSGNSVTMMSLLKLLPCL